eukprot:CAMPEP_0206316864 /NCGR_PEP_ID=MMETSP0106_2-20121207/16324_1 /ASSEMBLY_ACC=CAM_ASM_000206 /TAXON_ID=81532 /ORGANISM="Acanthoeca-like sp., Strain 10tr" /LENGTH=118 /DNA_ID=CAMNT_0053748407 /DNA_START=39 /DNA_END=392 /DNA_ORIENTATION=+
MAAPMEPVADRVGGSHRTRRRRPSWRAQRRGRRHEERGGSEGRREDTGVIAWRRVLREPLQPAPPWACPLLDQILDVLGQNDIFRLEFVILGFDRVYTCRQLIERGLELEHLVDQLGL